MWIDSRDRIMKLSLQYKLKGREVEGEPTTYGMRVPYEVATGCTA